MFAITDAFYWANPDWEPKTKILAAAAFNRARRWLLASLFHGFAGFVGLKGAKAPVL
jgi:hypothetical protein